VLSPGDRIKDYEVVAPIRSGGMAMLYLARRRGVGGFSRLVALKLVHSHLTDDPDINGLFLQEARIAASVAHPNVVHVEEVGSVDGKYFIAMEYVHGVSLDELLVSLTKQRVRMSPKLCVWVAAQVSEALHAVHEATGENGTPLNIVHRNVSPQNVLIGHNGHIKLIDFGIAKSQLMSHQASSRGSVIGKLRYMAPEQLRAQPVTRRTDVYALGVMLWEMLTSRSLLRCFRIDDERDWRTRDHPPAPSAYAMSLKPSIDRAVLRAIKCDSTGRFETAMMFRAALLRAEPAALQVDAPSFAALLNKFLGAELERRRANWPREINVQLDSDVISDTERSLNVEELTVRLKPAEVPEPVAEEQQEGPTTSTDSSPWGAEEPEGATVVERIIAGGLRPALRASSVQAQIPTGAARASTVRPHLSLWGKLKAFVRPAIAPIAGALLVALLAYGAVPWLNARRVDRALPSEVPGQASRVSAPKVVPKLTETQLASAARPEWLHLDAGKVGAVHTRVPPPPATKRTSAANKGAKKKGKIVGLGVRNRKPVRR
jgi:serine/threonine protein kinase